jgi:sigma-B regulation protein RsbU (phosphoserine phosphatase)
MAQSLAPAEPSSDPHHFYAPWLGIRVVLGPDWLFAADDNPAYAQPAFDDSGWKTISADRSLASYGFGPIPYAWYRMHVHVNPHSRFLTVEVQDVIGNYELYVNGVRIGASGSMERTRVSRQNYLASYDIPDSMIAPNGDLVLALRFAVNKVARLDEGDRAPLSADCILLGIRDEAARSASYEAAHQNIVPLMLCGLSLMVGIVSLALYLALRSQPEYLAIAISLFASGIKQASIIWFHLHAANDFSLFPEQIALGIQNFALIEFVRLILGLRRTRWLLTLEIVSSLAFLSLSFANLGFLSPAHWLAAYFVPSLIVKILLPVLLLKGLLRGNRDASVVLTAILIASIAECWFFVRISSSILNLNLPVPQMPYFPLGSYGLDFWSTGDVVFCVTMLLFLVLRTIGIAHERAQAAAELEAARTVQQVLIPEEIPTIPGFVLQSVYKPAGQVGGDFFQIVAVKGGGVLAVIGDVSGKGMPAAMTVSLLVGTFRSLAHYTQSPGEILAAMNQRMLARSSGGFTTCLVLRSDADGKLTVANAGHIAPYLAGKELPLENGLPLGLAANTTYAESSFQLAPGQQVTLITDGVVEARDKAGKLLGFDRSAALSTEPAEAIARAAQAFGQDDDITVLTLSYEGVAACA